MSEAIQESIARGEPVAEQQRLLEVQESQRRTRIVEAVGKLERLQETATWFGDLLDMQDSFMFDREDGVLFATSSAAGAYSRALIYPSDTAAAYINETEFNMIRARSRAFCKTNPYWLGVQQNIKTHAIGQGFVFIAAPKHAGEGSKVPQDALEKVQDEIDLFVKTNDYREVQIEHRRRLDRDGESFIRFHEENEDGVLRVRFVEPRLVWTPPGKSQQDDVWFGIQFKGDYEDPQGYYIRPTNYLGTTIDDARWGTMVPKDAILHRKANVDRSSPRGLPTTYGIQARLEQALKTLTAMGKLVHYREKIALIRKRINSTIGTVQALLSAQSTAQVTGPTGTAHNIEQLPDAAILDTNDQAVYEFPSQHVDTDKIVAAVQAELRAVAAALGMAEYIVSADCSTTSYANGMVAEGPVVRTFQSIQTDQIADDLKVLERAIKVAIDAGRLPADTLEKVKIDIEAPSLVGRNRSQDTQADQILNEKGVLSLKEWAIRNNLAPDEQRAQVKQERTEELDWIKKKAEAESPPGQPGGGSTFAQRPNQPSRPQKVTARPFAKDDEPRQKEEWFRLFIEQFGDDGLRLLESSHDARSQQEPTGEDMAMAGTLITPEWLAQVKAEILALPRLASPLDPTQAGEYEPGVRGTRLGVVDGQECWAVDMTAMMVKYNAPDLVVAGNSERWAFVPADKILVDWSFSAIDKAHDLLHEVVEYRLMAVGKWAYARAHRVAGCYEHEWLLALRPELAGLATAAE